MRKYTVVLSPDPERGGYSVSVPAMPGAVTEGDNREEALRNAIEAMTGWLAVSLEHGEDALEETPELIASEVASVLQDRDELGWDRLVETAIVALDPVGVAA
ncbi:MAG: type II toxin-antitoxin system HicB family antitoxin [Hyphomicrobiales bacterium]